jgi:hypothetical protein
MHHLRRSLLWLTFFSIAMGFLESAVVIYLRELYYPDGFQFPLVLMPHKMALTELIREAATLVMLGSIGILAGRNTAQRFSFFIYSFAVWDLFYYVFLKIILDWPESFFTWDILFLIPVPWVGPVIAPCIVSFSMIILTMVIIIAAEKEQHVRVNLSQWLLLISGAFIIILSFIWDYLRYMKGNYVIWTPVSEHEMFYEISGYIPQSFNWTLFIGGEILILTSIISIFLSIHKAKQKKLPAAF